MLRQGCVDVKATYQVVFGALEDRTIREYAG
jgi:hypothetical protein